MRKLVTEKQATLLAGAVVFALIAIAIQTPAATLPIDEKTKQNIDDNALLPKTLSGLFAAAFVAAIFINPKGAKTILHFK